MKIAIISDVHSNLEALQTALKIIEKSGVEKIYSCGDIVGYGPDPESCALEIIKKGITSVKGNHDAGVSGDSIIFNFNSYAREAILYTKRVISYEVEQFLKSLPYKIIEEQFTIFHGSLTPKAPFEYILTEDLVMENFSYLTTPIGFYGHTHVPCLCELDKNNNLKIIDFKQKKKVFLERSSKYLINVGSVGQPRDGDPRGSFLIYDDNEYSITLNRFNYDIETVYKKIIEKKLPTFLGERLFSGF